MTRRARERRDRGKSRGSARLEGVCERSSAERRSERDGERKDTLSGAILVIATRVLLHSPLNNAAPRAHTRHARATVCVRERAVSWYLRILAEPKFHTLARIAREGGSIIQGTREEIELYPASSLLCAVGCAPGIFFMLK